MSDVRTSTLPSVLSEYLPEFEETRTKVAPASVPTNCRHHHHTVPRSEGSPVIHNRGTIRKKSGKENRNSLLLRTPTPGSNSKKKDERVRQERVADTWDLARSEVLQERHEQLTQKVELQHALIKRQEERARQIRCKEEEKLTKKRAEELTKKYDRENALQDTGRQSIELDRKTKQKSKSKGKSKDNVTTETGNDSSSHSEDGHSTTPTTSSPLSPVAGEQRIRKLAAHRGYLPSSEYSSNLAPSPMRELEEFEDEDDDDDSEKPGGRRSKGEVVTPADLSQLPWHHAQLYRMYGRHADYYLHPKVQQEQKKVVHPTLKSQKGHLGASHIWNTLRTDSKSKLYSSDRRFPQELKNAFSAHVREGINNNKKPVFRNFTVADDVPDLNQLMDQSLLRRVAVLRHKTELMYRSSKTNNDRTKVLLFNSPLPAVNEGDEGIGKYLPSWSDDTSEISEASYMKWLDEERRIALRNQKLKGLGGLEETAGNENYLDDDDIDKIKDDAGLQEDGEESKGQVLAKILHPKSVLSPVSSATSGSLQAIWHAVMARQRPRRQPRYHFLTEEEAREEGAFLEKLGLEKDRLDRGRTDLLPTLHGNVSRQSLPTSFKSMSAQEPRRHLHTSGSMHARSDSAQTTNRFQSSWQPLSMHALVEYKDQMGTQGLGEFQHGRPKMWQSETNPKLQEQC